MLEILEKTRYRLISIDKLSDIARVQKSKPVAFSLDLETTGLNPLTGKIVTVQFGTIRNAFILDCRPYYTLPDPEKTAWITQLEGMLKACPLVVGHNLKFDCKWLKQHFGIILTKVADTMLQELVIHGVGMSHAENEGIAVNMEATGERYGLAVTKELQKWSVDLDTRPEWDDPFPENFLEYCAQDICIPLLIHSEQLQKLELLELTGVAEIENACLPALAQMELDGCYVDRERWQAIIDLKKKHRDTLSIELQESLTPFYEQHRSVRYEESKQELESWQCAMDLALEQIREGWQGSAIPWGKYKIERMRSWRGDNPRPVRFKYDNSPINLGSTQQLQIALALMGVHVESTDREHLAPYRREYPSVGKLLEWKALDKFINAFGDSLLAKIDVDGRIHPTYNQLGAATGRMSCSNPNWQQLPSHEPEETSVRNCVIAASGNVILTADFSNIEARILADISQDTNLLDFFKKDGDLHCTTARLMFGLTATNEELKGDDKVGLHALELRPGLSYRSVAKTINFGLVYGMSPIKLGRTLGISKEEATDLFTKYFEAYPGVASWLEASPKVALENGHSLTVSGRKRFYRQWGTEPTYDRNNMSWEAFREQRATWYRLRGMQERQAKNAPIQGSNADITKVALILLYHKIPAYVRLVACVHDEIVLECPEDKAGAVSKLLATAMHKACTKYLQYVHIPYIKVAIASYWKKD